MSPNFVLGLVGGRFRSQKPLRIVLCEFLSTGVSDEDEREETKKDYNGI